MGAFALIKKESVTANTTVEITLPTIGNYLLTVSNSYAVGCLYFICAGNYDIINDIYALAKNSSYFQLESIGLLKLRMTAGQASGMMFIYRISGFD